MGLHSSVSTWAERRPDTDLCFIIVSRQPLAARVSRRYSGFLTELSSPSARSYLLISRRLARSNERNRGKRGWPRQRNCSKLEKTMPGWFREMVGERVGCLLAGFSSSKRTVLVSYLEGTVLREQFETRDHIWLAGRRDKNLHSVHAQAAVLHNTLYASV